MKGNEIPLGARIVSVADAYHAMVHDRPYSAALSHEEALAELRQHAGTQFDPEVVEVFCTVYAAAVPPGIGASARVKAISFSISVSLGSHRTAMGR